jgi:D-inositol-3-phosphate glycosyltransferase
MMQAGCVSDNSPNKNKNVDIGQHKEPGAPADIEVGLLTGCRDKHYVYGLATALIAKGISLDLIGSDDVDSPDFHGTPRLNFLNLGGRQRQSEGLTKKASRVIRYYVRLIRYATVSKRRLFHILWNYKLEYFDRTVLTLYCKLLGKKIVFTAHNVNAGKRDSNDSLLNRLTLRIQYRLVDHIFVHTEQMKIELFENFGVRAEAVTVIPYGINNAIPCTDLTASDAKRRLGIKDGERTILFFGNIGPYKGLEYLVAAFQSIVARNGEYRLIIAGKHRGGAEKYANDIREATIHDVERGRVIQRIEHIPDEETELYFKAADVLVLPYTYIFQSGVLFLGYSFGLPVIATDVGSLREDIVEGETGFLCRPSDTASLATTIEAYFESDLFKNLGSQRQKIRDYAYGRHSWNAVGELTQNVYAELLRKDRP